MRGGTFDHSLRRLQLFSYRSQNPIRICQHIVIPKPQHQKPSLIECLRPARIFFFLFRMLAAVQLHNQPRVVTKKIGNITANGNLPAELEPVKLLVADAGPQFTLGIRFLPPEFAG